MALQHKHHTHEPRAQSPPVARHQDSVGGDVRALQARRNDQFGFMEPLSRWQMEQQQVQNNSTMTLSSNGSSRICLLKHKLI
jgi:hypothetical protein